MLKFLVIAFIIGLVIFRTMGFFLRLLSGSAAHQKQHRARGHEQYKTESQKHRKGDVNIDYVPKGKKGDSFHGGEYVDFEELN